MISTKPLLEFCAADLMSTDVVMISQEMSLQGAARMLARSHVGGAPVVDDQGCCVGVLSTTDYLHWAEQEPSKRANKGNGMCSAWQIMETDNGTDCLVKDYMSRDPVTADVNASIGELAHMMVDAHIHRIIIVDRDRRPIGVASSTDLLAALARAEDLHEEPAAIL